MTMMDCLFPLLVWAVLLLVALSLLVAVLVGPPEVASLFWGAITLMLFVPAGTCLSLIVGPLVGLGVGIVVLLGVVDGVALIHTAYRLARGAEPVRQAGVLTIGHHLVVLAVMSALGFAYAPTIEEALVRLAALAVPCGIGARVGWRLGNATPRRVARSVTV